MKIKIDPKEPLFFGGLIMVAVGLYFVGPPLALIVPGFVLMAVGLALRKGDD